MGWLYRGGTVWTGGEGLGSGAWRLALGGLAAELGCTQSAIYASFYSLITQSRTGQAHEDQLAL